MLRVIAVGDVHANWPAFWRALQSAGLSDEDGNPSVRLLSGSSLVLLMGDLVHPKTPEDYARISGYRPFDDQNKEHLKAAADNQAYALRKLREFSFRSGGHLKILLGNHDESALSHRHRLKSGAHLQHREFDPSAGGTPLDPELRAWFLGFAREVVIGRTHFAHVGPLPSMSQYDDFFYADQDPRQWFLARPELVAECGWNFGVYGHNLMPGGIRMDRQHRFAMIDALECGEYLELRFQSSEDLDTPPSVRVVRF
jgi:hypothetical protein